MLYTISISLSIQNIFLIFSVIYGYSVCFAFYFEESQVTSFTVTEVLAVAAGGTKPAQRSLVRPALKHTYDPPASSSFFLR